MSERTMRDRLRAYPKLKREIKNYEEWRLQCKSSEEGFSSSSKPSDGSKHQGGTGDRMERKIIDRLDEDAIRKATADKAHAEMMYLLSAIHSLDDPVYRMVLEYRYVESETLKPSPWGIVAKKLRGNDALKNIKYCERIHKEAIKLLEKSYH